MSNSSPYINHSEISQFVATKVNLKEPALSKVRNQANRVRSHINRYANEHPDVGFTKTILGGSLGKHTALKSINDIDIGLYIKATSVENSLQSVLAYIRDRLKDTYPNTPVKIDGPCVAIGFSGSDLKVEIMPILFKEDDKHGYGEIWDPYTLEKTYTSIPRHLEFIKNRRIKNTTKFAEIVRLVKHWKKVKNVDLRSFLVELILSKLSDDGMDFDDYKETLKSFFLFVIENDLSAPIFFTDYFKASDYSVGSSGNSIEIWDPVTPSNNVAKDCSMHLRDSVVEAAEDALDTLTYADNATTKGEAVQCWKDVLGNSFNA